MGASPSVLPELVATELAKPADGSDIEGEAALRAEVQRLRALIASEAAVAAAGAVNSAFVFIKPHACNSAVIDAVKAALGEHPAGFTITAESDLAAKKIDAERLIDNHYGAIAAKAVKLQPSELSVPAKGLQLFEEKYGLTWASALEQGLVFNAKDAMDKLGCADGAALELKWRAVSALKFGGGFYTAKIDDIWVMNGFYISMRSLYCTPPAAIHTLCVEWPAAKLSWGDFRATVLGATDPSTASEGSLRRTLFDRWAEFGLASEPNTGLNGVHGSASPFEALAERLNWCGATVESDAFGKGLLSAGVPKATIEAWTQDPQATLDGETGSLFDHLEDQNAADVLAAARRIA
jgi:nucleoside diphosphate kinase